MTCQRFEEEALLRLEQGEPLDEHFATCTDCLAARAAYEALQASVADLGAGDGPPLGWQAGVWREIEQRRGRSRRFWVLGSTGIAAALAATLSFVMLRTPSTPSLTQQIVPGGAVVRAAAPHPGDRLSLQAETAGASHVELRVYRNGREVVLRCPGDVSCRRQGSVLQAGLAIPSPGTFQALLLLGDKPLPPPGAGLDSDSGAALRQGARVLLGYEITVH